MDCIADGGSSPGSSAGTHEPLASLMDGLMRAKRERREYLAALPFEEKIRIVVELQKIAGDIRTKTGRSAPKAWDIPS